MTFSPAIVPTDTTETIMDVRLRPGAVLPSGRLQRGLLCNVQIVSGEVAFAVEGYDLDVETGADVIIEPHDDPAVWNTGDEVAHLRLTLRTPAGLSDEDLTQVMLSVETLIGFGSMRDVTGRAGDAPLREAIERELGELADLVRVAPVPAEQFLAAA